MTFSKSFSQFFTRFFLQQSFVLTLGGMLIPVVALKLHSNRVNIELYIRLNAVLLNRCGLKFDLFIFFLTSLCKHARMNLAPVGSSPLTRPPSPA